jgi:flagellar biosynthetic protein FliR
MDYTQLLNDKAITTFFLLFIRWSALFAFLPVFNFHTIPNTIKAAFVFWFTIVTFTLVPLIKFDPTLNNIILATINEITFGFFTGIALQIVFIILQFAGQLISFVMGLTMATIVDPNSGIQTSIISQFLNLLAIIIFLSVNGHYLMLELIANSLQSMPFGEFFKMNNMAEYIIHEMNRFFILGFSLVFPILAISFLSDIIFGMIMKSMPQFNLLVIGFPIKITLSFIVIIAILGSMMFMFKKEIFDVIKILSSFI